MSPANCGAFFGFLGEGKWRTPLAIRRWVGMALRQGHEAEFVALAIRLLRIVSTLFLLIYRAYRLVHGSTTPIAGFRDFVSHF